MFNAILRSPKVFLPVAAALLAGVSSRWAGIYLPTTPPKVTGWSTKMGAVSGTLMVCMATGLTRTGSCWHEDYAFRREILGGREIGE